ncbi:MAG TPA: hypothetical protein VGT03_16350 [Candidatus Acidoferrales bacterium]|nr:hypothetical protein [Candidatus Acidoferrales bacterium]
MKSQLLYRIVAVLLLLFAVGHTLGFRKVDPRWGANSVVESMRSFHFQAQGFSRTYWEFYSGFGFFVGVFLLFTAVLTWQFGGLPSETLARLSGPAWALAGCFIAVTVLSWRYFFIAPIAFSVVIDFFLIMAAWTLPKPS